MTVDDLVWIDETGYNYEDFPSFLAFFTANYQSYYGPDAYLEPDSQDGQWIASQAQAAYDTAAKGAMTYLSFSPSTAQGTGLSRLVKINGLKRDDPEFSTVDLDIVGVVGTSINEGVASDTLQQLWNLPTPIVIPMAGTITVTATAAVKGAVIGQAGTITGIFTPTRGWQTVNNPLAATIGSPVENDPTLRQRQSQSTALPSLTVLEGTVGAVADVTGVTAVQPYENDGDVVDANGLPPHSISLVVLGGLDSDVAHAIQVKKTPGTNTFGTTAVPTTDSEGVPITIRFFRPTAAVIGVQVTITELAGWTNDYEALIQQAVAAAVVAVPIGGRVILTKLFLSAYLQGTPAFGTFEIVSIELQKNGGGFAGADIPLLFNENATCDGSPAGDVVIVT